MSNNNINKIEFDPDSNVAVGDDPLLTGVDVFFRTNNDFKHESTELVNEIQEKNGANWVNKAFADGLYWKFNDESDNGPFSLFVYSPRPKKVKFLACAIKYLYIHIVVEHMIHGNLIIIYI